MDQDITKKHTAIWNLGKFVWISLFIGGLVVFVSLVLFQCRFPSSGAVLVRAAIISELVYTRLKWFRSGATLVAMEDGLPVKAIYEKISKSRELWALSKSSELYHNGWRIDETADRISLRIAILIAIAAILGTLIWGYGDLVIPTECMKCC